MLLTCGIVLVCMLFSVACAKIPEDDELFLSRFVPLGMDHTTASQLASNRGFVEKKLLYRPSYSFNHKTKSFDEDAYDYLRYVNQNVGFVKVFGKPEGILFVLRNLIHISLPLGSGFYVGQLIIKIRLHGVKLVGMVRGYSSCIFNNWKCNL
jgi:hypothetical protein